MKEVFLGVFNISVTASWIVLAVMLLRFALKRAPRWIVCLLWAIVGLRLIMPFSLESAFSLIPGTEIIDPATYQVQTGVEFLDDAANDYLADFANPPSENPVQIPDQTQSNAGGEAPVVTVPAPVEAVDPVAVASMIWIAGMVVMAVYSMITYLRLRCRVAVSIRSSKHIYFCDNIQAPFILGIVRPRIYLPSGMPDEQMHYVILHEKAHLNRKDHLWKPLGFLLLTVYWFNPVMWIAYILLCRDIELACDACAVREMDLKAKKGYSEALVACSIQRRMITACPVAFGEIAVKDRIKSVLHYKKPAFWVVLIAIAVCVVAAVCFLTSPADSGNDITEEDIKKVYSYQDAEAEIRKIREVIASAGTMTAQEEARLNKIVFQIISRGERSAADEFAALTREITNNTIEFENEEVFALAENYAAAFAAFSAGTKTGIQNLELHRIDPYNLEIEIDYLGDMRYSVRMIEIGDNWYYDPNDNYNDKPYNGELGDYLVEIAFYDFNASSAFFEKYPTGTHNLGQFYYGSDGAEVMMKHVSTASHGHRFYIGYDFPFSVEEKAVTEVIELIGSVSVTLTQSQELALEPDEVFPDAPKKAAVMALPEKYDAKMLVTPYWEQQINFGKSYSVCMSIPQIYPFSEDAIACQQEIYELLENVFDDEYAHLVEAYKYRVQLQEAPEDIFFKLEYGCYSYLAGCYQDILSIIVRKCSTESPISWYEVYYLDLTTGKRLTQDEANARYAVDKADIKRAVEAYFYEVHGKDFADEEALKNTLSDENIDACRIFCTEDGTRMLVADVYGFAAVSNQEKLIELP